MNSAFNRRLLRALWRRIRPYCSGAPLVAAYFSLGLPSYLRGLMRARQHHVRDEWTGDRALDVARNIAILVHYDRQGEVDDWLRFYVGELNDAGYTVIFISNAPQLTAEAIAKVRPHCGLVLRRDNVGRDFGAYKDAIDRIPDLGRLDSLVLANDSVYGPFHPLSGVLRRMAPDQASVWGMTDSLEGRFHLQSYFLLFHPAALRSEAFGRFWDRYRHVQNRYWNILRYELGLTRAMARAGFRCRALFPYRQATGILGGRGVQANAAVPARDAATPTTELVGRNAQVNPTHDLWKVLIGDLGCPFIKRDLLRSDPASDPDLQSWRAIVKSVSDYDTTMIPGHPPVRSGGADG